MAESIEGKRGGGLSMLDTALVVAGIVGGIFVILWIVGAVAHLVLFAFKIAVLVVVVALAVRLFHLFSSRS